MVASVCCCTCNFNLTNPSWLVSSWTEDPNTILATRSLVHAIHLSILIPISLHRRTPVFTAVKRTMEMEGMVSHEYFAIFSYLMTGKNDKACSYGCMANKISKYKYILHHWYHSNQNYIVWELLIALRWRLTCTPHHPLVNAWFGDSETPVKASLLLHSEVYM